MLDSTDPVTTPAAPNWCHWHKGESGTALLVRVTEQASGPGAGLYACAPCREQRGLSPLADEPTAPSYTAYIKHTQVCRSCGVVRRCDWGAQLWNAYQTALHHPAAI